MSQSQIELVCELSPMQQAMLFHGLVAPGSGVYLIQQSLRLTGRLDVSAFQRAWRHLAERHEILRTAFFWEDLEKPLQVIYRQVDLEVERASWRGVDPAEQQARLAVRLEADRERGLDLSVAPLMRLALIELDTDVHQLLWTLHHLLVDGWSQGQLLRELFVCYEAFAGGREPQLPPAQGFRDYIAWLQRQSLGPAESFWRKSLAGFASPTFLAEGPGRPDVPDWRAARRRNLALSPETSGALRAAARRHRLTLNTLVQGAWALLLSRATGREDVVFGATVSGRPAELPGVESILGLFINTLPVRVEVRPEPRLGEWLADLQRRQVEARRYQHAPLVEVQRWSELPAGTPLFDHLLVFENLTLPAELERPAPELAVALEAARDLTNYPLSVAVLPGEELALSIHYDSGRFEEPEVVRMLERLARLLAAFGTGWDATLGELPRLLDGERHQVLVEWNDTSIPYPREACLAGLFAEAVRRGPDAPALVPAGGATWSYRRLDEESNRLARHLRALGVRAETAVGVALERSPELVLGLLAILKAGGTYVPLDVAHPDERLAFVLAELGAPVVLVDAAARPRLEPLARVLPIDGDGAWRQEEAGPLGVRVPPEALACVIYTSGSTGRPKGVAVTHRAVARLVWGAEDLELRRDDRLAFNASPAFDAATFEIWGTLLCGAALVVIDRETLLAPERLAERLRRERITVLHLTSALFNRVVRETPEVLPPLRRALFGGEAPDPAAVAVALRRPPERLLHTYGPTESTTFATWHRVTNVPPGAATVPIGRPLANTSVYVLDRWQAPVAAGEPGELCIGGDGLARGYWNRPELTAERFVPHPWAAGERLYRSGDRVRRQAGGTLEFLGRLDGQVKIRGVRIEPGEIEAVLASHPAVRACAVAAREEASGERRLVAWVVPHPTDRSDRSDRSDDPTDLRSALRAWLQERLPAAFLPSAFVVLDALPLTPSGKVDRRALPAPVRDETGSVAPSGPVEELLAGIWAEVLGVERVGAHDDFFALGGHSLLATRVVSRVRAVLGVDVPLRTLFEAPTVAGWAAWLEAARPEGASVPVLRAVSRDCPLPLSFAQQRLWFLDRLEPGGAVYNLPLAVRCTGRLRVAELAASLQFVAGRHEALRTTFIEAAETGGAPVQVIAPAPAVPLPVADLAGLPGPARAAEADRLAAAEARRPFDLERGPLLRAALLRLAQDESDLLLTLHHIVSDAWSMEIFTRELAAAYGALCRGKAPDLPGLPVQYADYAVWQRDWLAGEGLELETGWWRDRLAGAPTALELPVDRPRPLRQAFRGAAEPVHPGAELSHGLEALSRERGVTLFMTLLAAWAAHLGRLAGVEDLLLGTPIAGRNRTEIEGLIGFFVNLLVLRVDLGGDPPFAELLRRVREATLDAYAHQDLPFEKLVEAIQPERDASRPPLVQVVLALQNAPAARLDLPEVVLTPRPLATGTTKFDLGLSLAAAASGLDGAIEHDRDLFDRTTVRRMLASWQALLAGAVARPESRLSDLPWLSEAERHQLLVEWNRAEDSVEPLPALHELFQARAVEAPGSVALSASDVWITYGELARRAHRLAWRLRALGVGPEVRVGLQMERSAELVVGLLAILEAGGAYVPLDPAIPEERRSWIAQDAFRGVEAPVVVTAALVNDPSLAAEPVVPPPSLSESGHAAYVIYTSGSTGRPKGVVVTHGNVARLLRATAPWFGFGPDDVWTLFHSFAFDFSVWEIWGALAHGGRLVVVPREVAVSPEELGEILARERVTVLNQTPSAFRQLAAAEAAGRLPRDLCLRLVIFGGEALDPAHLIPWVRGRGDAAPRLVNMYGITETTVHVTGRTITGSDLERAGQSPIGRPIPDLRICLVDPWLAPVPVGVPGEILVGGPGLARGYLHRPDLTAERFVPDPFGNRSGRGGERLYRSGDLARFRPDGDLEYLGRADHQVKIRGYRIEPAEVEAALAAHPAVGEAVVVAREDRPGDRRLVAYVVLHRTDPTDRTDPSDDLTDQTTALAAWLRDRLPQYMVPSAFVLLDALPLTPHGKLDRRALPEPPAERPGLQEGYAAPADPLEEELAALFAEVLGLARIGVRDGFFEAGGHSLLATRVISRVRESLGVDVPLRALFDSPTVAGLAEAVRPLLASEGLAAERLGPSPLRATGGPFPLSFSQERLWFLDQLDPGTPAFNIPFAVDLGGRLVAEALERALAEIVRRHEALRTRFPAVDGRAVQEILPYEPRPLPCVDLTGLPEPLRGAEEERLTRGASERRLDLARGPLLAALLLRRTGDDHRLVLVIHHIVADGWSMSVLWRELAALYGAFAAGEPSPLPPLPLQYADFADWQRRRLTGERLESQLAWWRERLAGVPVLELRGDRPRPAVQTFRGGRVELRLSAELVARLSALAHAAGGSLFMALLAGFEALLGRWSGQTGFAVGTFIANRHRAEVEGLIGFFVNNLALRADLAGRPGLGELLRRTREVTLGAYAHQDLPFEKLLEELRPERDMSRPSLFQVMCVLQNVPRETSSLPGLTMAASEIDSHRANFDLTLWMAEDGGEIDALLDFNADLFDAPTIARLAGHLRRLLASGAAEPDRPVADLPLLGQGERWQLLEWRGAPALWDAEVTVHDLILRQAGRTPEALAVVSPATGERLTYAELARRSGELAGRLRALGVGPEVPVAICLERTAELIVAVLATLRAGGCYVPLDPAFSEDRLSFLVEDSGAGVVITSEGSRVVHPSPARGRGAGGEGSLAYIVYTSGSTGRPKGVLVEHRSLANAYFAWEEAYGLRGDAAGAVHLQMAAFTFDVFSGDFVRALCSGGTLVLCPRETLLDPPRLLELMRSEKVTAAEFVPAVVRGLQEVLERDGGTLDFMRLLIVGSDLWSVGEMRALARFCGPRTRLIDSYGASEATIDTTFFEPSPASGRLAAEGPVPVGRPFRGSEVYVVDAGLTPLPIGVAGELVIGGPGVARGYVGRPDLTAERFVPHPLSASPGARLYRTGDLVRWLADGNLEILGRVDDQVKVRGHRIEPGEIEAVLAEHPRVRQAAVVAVPEKTGEKRLAAWVVLHQTDPTDRTDPTDYRTDPTALSSWLRKKLPDFMIPTAWGVLDELPLNTSGKVDRRALRELPAGWVASEDAAPPRGPVAELLAAIWADLLGLGAARLGTRDDFFALGGHSLLATRLVSRVRDAFGIDLPLVRVFDSPSLETLAGRIEEALASGRAALPPIRPVPRDGDLPLSFSQERLWFLDRLEPGSPAYNIPLPLALRGPLSIPALQAALGEVVRRHESLRTTFAERGGEPVQMIAPPGGRFPLPVVDLAALPAGLGDAETRRLAIAEALRPFDLRRGPLFRATLVRAAGDEHAVLLDMHHAVSDLWSLGVLVREISVLYEAARAGRPSPLPELPVQYADFAVWQRERLWGDVLERQAEHWRRRLAGAPTLDLPTDRPRPPVQSFRGSSVTERLDGQGVQSLQALGRRHGATLFMTLLAGFAAYLWRVTRQADLVLGTPIAGRRVLEVEPLIGFFVNSLVLRIELPGGPEGDPTVAELIAAARREALDAYMHQDLPFERLVEELRPERHLSHNPLFQVMFTLQNAPLGPFTVPDLSLALLDVAPPTAKFDLGATFTELADCLGIALDYALDLFDAPTVRRMAGHLTTLLSSLEPERRISELPLLTEVERHQLLEHNDAPEEPEPPGVVEELGARFARTPGETALVCGEESLTCSELERRSAAVARRLRAFGVGPGSRVGLLADRTPALVVGLLGILRAGGAFVALDPAHPESRLSFLLKDSETRLVLGEERWRALLPESDLDFVPLEEEIGGAPADGLPLPAPDDLAYLLYTSGTTGRPKAVLVEHRHLAATLAAARRRLGLAPGVRMPCVAPFTFDIFLFELLAPLLAGGTVTLVPLRPVLDVEQLALSLAGMTAFHAVPALMRRVVDAVRRRPEDGYSLRQVFVGGDAVPPELLVDLRQVFPQAQVWVLYGPTETTILASAHRVPTTGPARPLLGRPLGRATLSVRDAHGGEVPAGVPGEIWIGGPTVARGYWRREELTAERFLDEEDRRFFRTGDLARRLPDGTLEFLGRVDQQVKVRGFRIEPGEVEGVLARHPEVDEVVVAADEDPGGGKRLVAWVVRRRSPAGDAELAAEQVASWRALYDETYAGSRAPETSVFDIEGWNSSYTGEPIPAEEMSAWVDGVVERVRALGGRRVLEVGCGTGLVLFRLVPHVDAYLGTDFSAVALEGIRRRLHLLGEAAARVTLERATADDWSGVSPGDFDVVVLSSVVQYFPGIDYLARVLERAVAAVSPRGAVFIGDVRSLPLLETFRTSVELYRAPDDLTAAELRRRVRRAVAAEEELVIDPAFFNALAQRIPDIRGVEILPEPGPFQNEMTRFRYDVILRVGTAPAAALPFPLEGLLDARLGEPLAARALLAEADGDTTVAELRRLLASRHGDGGEPLRESRALANDPLRARAAQRLVPELRRFAQRELPEYMVPSAFVLLDELPLTPHGKVDRAALPPPDAGRQGAGAGFVPPRTPEEEIVARLWSELLGAEQVGVDDDFFDLGGHSLLATQLVSRLRDRCGVDLPVRAVFERSTVALLAEAVQAAVPEPGNGPQAPPMPPILPVPRDGDLPLSFAQQRLWFLDQLEPGNPVYIIPSPVRLTGEVSARDLSRIFGEVVRRHEALRTTFDVRRGRPVQVIAPPASTPALPLVDLSGLPEPEREARAGDLVREDARRPFDLRRGPLLRLCLIRLAGRDHVLLMTMHHIVSDGWSMGVLIRELGLLHEALAQGRPSPLPELPVQYADFAAWQREWLSGEVLEGQLAYWRRELAGAPRVLELPLDRPRPAVQSYHGAEQRVTLPPGVSAAVRELCRREGATPFMVLLAAWGLLLGRHADQEEVLLGTPIAGRNRQEIESLIGFFVNTLVMRVDLGEAPGFAGLVGRVRRAALDAYAHQDVPFERLVEELVPERDLSRSPLFQAMFVLQNAPRDPLSIPGLTLAPIGFKSEAAAVELTLTCTEGTDGFSATIEHNIDLFDRSTASRFLARFEALLSAAAGDPEGRIRDLPLLLEGERHQALVEWNDAVTSYPRGACLAELFEDVARRLPDAPAVIGAAGEVWCYRRLETAANRLARRLRALGVGPETAVGISMERSPELIVGILAILKAGGFYVPLDPGYPDERLDFMLADTGAAVVLVNARTRERLEGRARLLEVDDQGLETLADPLGIRVPAESLAYVIYTSGSTGAPKGAAVPQRGVVRLVRETNYVRLGPGDRVGHASNISFDSATYEIWGALLNGGTLVVIPREVVLSPVDFAAWIRERAVDSLTLTTALFHQIAREVPDAFAPLRELLPGGEAMDPAVVRAVLAAGPPRCLINGYGPTESTTLASWHPLREMPAGAVTVPIGRPLANTSLYVLDRSLAAVPPGVVGELCLGGDGLARGYLNQPELTAEKFVPDAFAAAPGSRLYRTGDLARWRSRGELEYLGRIDHQVKVRGFRIEPGEIEAALSQQPNVRAAVVLVREDSPGDRRLVAYVMADQEPGPRVEELRAGLEERLPDYMIPSAFVLLERLPLTPNGKVDRSALPRVDGRRPELRAGPVAPRTPLEEVLAGLWAEILGLDEVGVEDDFFTLGGHSLLATQLLSAVRDAFDEEIPVQSLFERRTVAGMAEALLEVAGDPVRVERTAELLLEVASLSDEEVDVVLGEAGR